VDQDGDVVDVYLQANSPPLCQAVWKLRNR
jgi:hypothetical protein